MTGNEGFRIVRWDIAAGRLDDILALVHAAFQGLDPPSSVLRETLLDFARRLRDEITLVAMADEAIVGSMFCAAEGDALYLTRMAVADGWRGQGVGAALLATAEDHGRAAAASGLTLRVRRNLPGNRAYFERHGFVVTAEGQDAGHPPYQVMERPLV